MSEQPPVRARGRVSDPAPVRQRRIAAETEEQKITRRQQDKLEKRANQKRLFLEKLAAHLGVIAYACEEMNVARRTIYYWIENDHEFAAQVREVEERQKDFVERKLLEGIQRGNPKLITFYLSTKGGDRGYRPRVTVSTPSDEPFEVKDVTPPDEDEGKRKGISMAALSKALVAASKVCPGVFHDHKNVETD